MKPGINIPDPELQIDFSFALGQIRSLYLQDALGKTVEDIDLATLDKELTAYVRQESLKILAKHGLRGELVFPVPCLLAQRESPSTNTFYRLSALKQADGEEYQDFKDRVISLTGIRSG